VAERSLIVQPFVDEIVTQGEWSLVFFSGEYSHAVLKRPAEGDFRVQEELGGHALACDPPSTVIEQARSILARVPSTLLYARVDGVERNGRFVLMEVEINEPFLYRGHPQAPRPASRMRSLAQPTFAARNFSSAPQPPNHPTGQSRVPDAELKFRAANVGGLNQRSGGIGVSDAQLKFPPQHVDSPEDLCDPSLSSS
jgi:hypothetical protein